MISKSDLRARLLQMRDLFTVEEKSAKDQFLSQKLLRYIDKLNPKFIHTYLPIGSEINFYPAIEYLLNQNITIVCPKTENKPIFKNLVLSSLDKLEQGRFGTRHPANAEEYRGNYDLIIVPGLAYNAEKYRLGYGGGYYDYFLKSQPNAIKLGLFYSFQKCEDLPVESHDMPLDIVMTDLSA